jgi:hypothetical protein
MTQGGMIIENVLHGHRQEEKMRQIYSSDLQEMPVIGDECVAR